MFIRLIFLDYLITFVYSFNSISADQQNLGPFHFKLEIMVLFVIRTVVIMLKVTQIVKCSKSGQLNTHQSIIFTKRMFQ